MNCSSAPGSTSPRRVPTGSAGALQTPALGRSIPVPPPTLARRVHRPNILRRADHKSPSGCGKKEVKDWRSSIRVGECHANNLQSQSGEEWALLPPRIKTKRECSAEKKDVVEELDPARFGAFYRSCKTEQDIRSCGDEDDICLKAKAESPWINRVCIAKQGQHECESSDYPVSIVTFSGYLDQRGCTSCTATKRDDEEHCE